MHIFFSESAGVNRLIGPENSTRHQRLLSQFKKVFGSNFEPVFQVSPGLPVRLLQQQLAERPIPAALQARHLTTPHYQAQFQNPLSTLNPDVIVLSVEPDLHQTLWQHKETGFLLCPDPQSSQDWLQAEFEPLSPPGPAAYEAQLLALIADLKAASKAAVPAVLILNGSTVDPDDNTFTFRGLEDNLPVRINRFNLALLRVSMQAGISIVDVDRLAAEAGQNHILGLFHYSDSLNDTIRQEIVRIINDRTAMPDDQPVYKLEMPHVDLTVKEGVVSTWHKTVGDAVKVGDKLVDLEVQFQIMQRTHSARFLSRNKTKKAGGKTGRLLIQLLSAGDGTLHQIYSPLNSTVKTGTLMAAITAENIDPAANLPLDVTTAPIFKISAQKLSIGKDQ